MKYKTFLPQTLLIALMLCLAFTAYPSQAGEIRYPVPCYEGEELAKVREWEKEWVGKKIDASNIAGVKEFLPDAMYTLHTDTEKWGPTWFTIVPYQVVQPTTGDLKYTLEGKASVGPEGTLENYVSGIPFPQAKTAEEKAYNFDNINFGDQFYTRQLMKVVDGRRQYDRGFDIETTIMYFAGRRDIPEAPTISYNPKGIYRGIHSWYNEPAAYKGTRSLLLKWNDREKDWASWSFSSATRRIYRRSMAERQSSQGGMDMCSDDTYGYNWAINAQNWKDLGRKELLLPRHQDAQELVRGHTEGKCLNDGAQRERINTHALEAVHKDPDYVYSKQIYYLDPETWAILYADKFDREGKLWKVLEMPSQMWTSQYDGQKVQLPCSQLTLDFQRVHSSPGMLLTELGHTGEFYTPEFYEPRALQKYGY